MIPRSKQPNEYDAYCDPDEQGQDASEAFTQAWQETARLQALLAEGQPGSGAGQWVTSEGRHSPADFSGDDLSLARDLNGLFSVEREELPPLFVQTLAGVNQDWQAPSGLTQRVTYHVFRHLHLPRRLFPIEQRADRPAGIRVLKRLPRAVGVSTVLALVLMSLVAVAPSFANGLRLLLGNTGVQVAPSYPSQAINDVALTQYLSLRQAEEIVPFQTVWLGESQAGYHYQSLLLHMGQQWANGPVVEVQYRLPHAVGTGLMSVREFLPSPGSTVLLVVAEHAAQPVQVAGQQAIYINGRWVRHQGQLTWEYGTQAELLYQANGLIFWITADQRDGATPDSLEAIATSLTVLYLGAPRLHLPELLSPLRAQTAAALAQASLGDVIALVPAGASPQTGAAVYIALGQPPDADA